MKYDGPMGIFEGYGEETDDVQEAIMAKKLEREAEEIAEARFATQANKTLHAEYQAGLRGRCYAFVSNQSAGEWDDKTILNDTNNLMAFVEAETYRLLSALKPFSRLADALFEPYETRPGQFRDAYSDKPDDENVWAFNGTSMTFGHLRAARSAIHALSANHGAKAERG